VGGAPDLSTSAARLGADSLRAVLLAGRPDRGMPAPYPAFSEAELEDLMAFLDWMGARRDSLSVLLRAADPDRRFSWRDLPWWEYR
jgi:hypothetical protein